MNEKDTPYNSCARLIKSMKFNLTRSHHISIVIIGNGVAADIVQLNASSATNKSVTPRSMLHENHQFNEQLPNQKGWVPVAGDLLYGLNPTFLMNLGRSS